MARHKLIKLPPLNRTPGVCLKTDKRGKPTKTQSKRRRTTSKSKVAAATSVQFPRAGFDPSMEIAEERRAWSELDRDLARDAKNFDLEASIKRLGTLSLLYDGAKNTQKREKYKVLQHVYEQFALATISGQLPELIAAYRKRGMIIHNDVHPLLAIIRANITVHRDCVHRWGLVLRYAHTKQIRPKKLIGFLKEHGMKHCRDEFRKLQAQAQIAADNDEGTRAKTSVTDTDTKNKTTKTSDRDWELQSGKQVMGKAGDETPIETTTDFDVNFIRITRNRKDVSVTINGHVSADGRLSLRSVRISDGSLAEITRPNNR
jgi:hypothetical protein